MNTLNTAKKIAQDLDNNSKKSWADHQASAILGQNNTTTAIKVQQLIALQKNHERVTKGEKTKIQEIIGILSQSNKHKKTLKLNLTLPASTQFSFPTAISEFNTWITDETDQDIKHELYTQRNALMQWKKDGWTPPIEFIEHYNSYHDPKTKKFFIRDYIQGNTGPFRYKAGKRNESHTFTGLSSSRPLGDNSSITLKAFNIHNNSFGNPETGIALTYKKNIYKNGPLKASIGGSAGFIPNKEIGYYTTNHSVNAVTGDIKPNRDRVVLEEVKSHFMPIGSVTAEIRYKLANNINIFANISHTPSIPLPGELSTAEIFGINAGIKINH